jgi:nucleoid-associated protein YgaU
MRFALVPVLTTALFALPACRSGQPPMGVIIGADGQAAFHNAANVRAETERTIERALARELAPSWRSTVAIADDPRWDDDRESWRWPATMVRVELSGDASVPPPLDAPTITAAVIDYFANRLIDAKQPVQVTVATAAAREAAPADPAAPAAPANAPANGPQPYTIQPGDTLARISAVFYGSPQHWRRIVEANPGLQPENLAVGREIVIPPAPTAP